MATRDSGPSFLIRPARFDDIERLREIEQKASEMFLGTPHAIVAELPVMTSEFIGEQIGKRQVWAACDDGGKPIGFAVALVADGEAHLNELCVDPCHGRKGVGRGLVDVVCEWARSSGYDGITLSTFRNIPWNAPFYRRLGFVEVSEGSLGPELLQFRLNEQNAGLDLNSRLIMRKPL